MVGNGTKNSWEMALKVSDPSRTVFFIWGFKALFNLFQEQST